MPIIGLNLGKTSFRAVELEKKKDAIYLQKFGMFENPRLNLDSDAKEDTQAFSEALSNFFDQTGFSSNDVVVGLDESSVFMRIISLPMMNDKDLKTSIRFESEQYIPLPLSEVNLTYQKLDVDITSKDKMNVQVVAAKNSILDRYVDILRRAKLVPKAIEPETLALARALGDTRAAPIGTAVLEIGLSGSIISIVYGGFVRFSRNVAIGGDVINKALVQNLGLDTLQAEEYKKVYGMDQFQMEGKLYNVIKPLVDNIILEVNRAALFFTNHHPSANIKKIVLTGGTALMPGLLLHIASNLDYEVELANPIKNLQLNPKIEDQRKYLIQNGPLFSTAIGLGLRELA